MGRLHTNLDYEDKEFNKPHKRLRKFKESKPKRKSNKRLIKNLEFHTEKDSQSNVSIMDDMLKKIAGKPENKPTVTKNVRDINNTLSDQPKNSDEGLCEILGLKFTTNNKMVLKLFTDPLSISKGSVFYIKDAYINGEVELVQILNKSCLMYVFKKLSSGNITTYTNVSLKDATDIRYVSPGKS